MEDQFLERVESRPAEPIVVEADVGGEVEEFGGEAASGARVSSKDMRNDLDALIGEVDRLEAVVEVEQRGAPHVAPAAGEDGGAGALVGFEEGDYGAKDPAREAADQIRPLITVDLFVALLLLLPLPGDDDAVHGDTGRSDRDTSWSHPDLGPRVWVREGGAHGLVVFGASCHASSGFKVFSVAAPVSSTVATMCLLQD